jgi:dihydropteroate synthase
LEKRVRKEYLLKLPKRSIELGRRTLVMGILNVTPDSFSDGGRFFSKDEAVKHALRLVSEGADIIDIGGESTRPGADPVSTQDELDRVIPIIELLKDKIEIPISIDTYKSEVAERAIKAGAEIINDISGLKFDSQLAEVAAKTGATLCLMHTRGTPQIMQKIAPSKDIWKEILSDLKNSISQAGQVGVERSQIIIDPGIGFGKTMDDNLLIINQLDRLNVFSLPILIGTSRKSFIGKLTDRPQSDRLMGTAASVAISIMHGAHMVRVHDVEPIVETVRISDAILQAGI